MVASQRTNLERNIVCFIHSHSEGAKCVPDRRGLLPKFQVELVLAEKGITDTSQKGTAIAVLLIRMVIDIDLGDASNLFLRFGWFAVTTSKTIRNITIVFTESILIGAWGIGVDDTTLFTESSINLWIYPRGQCCYALRAFGLSWYRSSMALRSRGISFH